MRKLRRNACTCAHAVEQRKFISQIRIIISLLKKGGKEPCDDNEATKSNLKAPTLVKPNDNAATMTTRTAVQRDHSVSHGQRTRLGERKGEESEQTQIGATRILAAVVQAAVRRGCCLFSYVSFGVLRRRLPSRHLMPPAGLVLPYPLSLPHDRRASAFIVGRPCS